jgi:hypothetical protein
MTLGENLADDLFRAAESIDRSGIVEIDTALDRRSDRGNGSDVPAMAARSISISPVSVSRAMVLLLRLRGLRRLFSVRSRASPQPRRIDAARTCVASLSVRHLASALLLHLRGLGSACS